MSDCGVNVHKSGDLKIPTMRLSKLPCNSAVGALAGSATVRRKGREHTIPVGRNEALQPTISTLSIHRGSDSCNVVYTIHITVTLCGTTMYVLPQLGSAASPQKNSNVDLQVAAVTREQR